MRSRKFSRFVRGIYPVFSVDNLYLDEIGGKNLRLDEIGGKVSGTC